MAIAKNKIADPKRILVLKFSSIGDIILTTSPIKSLKQIFPNTTIDLITLSNFVQIVEGNQYIDRIISHNRNDGLIKLIKTGQWINNSDYDLVIDFHNSLRSKIIRLAINKIPIRYLKKPRWKRFFLFRLRKNYFTNDFSQLQLLHQPICELVSGRSYPLPELFVSNSEKSQAKEMLSHHGVTKEFITIIPAAAWPQKQWIASEYISLIEKLNSHTNYDFVILGGKNDEICTKIAKDNSSVINLQGKTNLREAMSILAISKYAIGADTGLVHAAEALGKNVAVILGPTSRETGAGTYRDGSIDIENNEIWCRPCSQAGTRKCYRDEQYCRTTISAELVFDKLVNGGLH